MIPTYFTDDAEFIWRELEAGYKQQDMADMLGWSRDKVKNYKALDNIHKDVWEIIGTTFQNIVPIETENGVPSNGTNVPFSEGLLRNILDLTPEQQSELVTKLAKNNGYKMMPNLYGVSLSQGIDIQRRLGNSCHNN